MPEESRDGARVRFPPPFVFLIMICVGASLQLFVMPLFLAFPKLPRMFAAVACGVVGLGLIAAAMGLFKKSGQAPQPWKATPEIISTGIYRWTRNPMYVGMALLQAAAGFWLLNVWVLGLIPFSLLLVYLIAVRQEEAYLAQKFGQGYLDYKNAVRRWL